MATFFFWVGITIGVYTYWKSLEVPSVKVGPLTFPFLMLLAAAVAKYIGW